MNENNTNCPKKNKPNYSQKNKHEDLFINLWGSNGQTNYIKTSAWLTPRRLIEKNGDWDESLLKDQDGEFFARIGLSRKGIKYVPNVKCYYRKHVSGNNIASQLKKEHLISNLKAIELGTKKM
ncbi:hypothetical protein CDL62_18335 [Alkalitalea saponilacus]|uniref:hypothetical protein n=1 Tax=Alkalitalea saponilacus TaxID=889453 RepID=UPI0009A755E7|nr:hypothetical protein [Alkalitalea saponilacus]ASB50965.1 hypothetical protein CDL62_18335 [Alkalitalea saponilacus]